MTLHYHKSIGIFTKAIDLPQLLQILQQRVQSAKIRHVLKKQSSVTSSDEDADHLTVPPNIPKTTNPYDVSYI